MNDKGIIIYSSMVAFGTFVVGLIASIFHSTVVLPIVVTGMSFTILLLLLVKNKKIAHVSENLEKIVFILILIAIIFSFIVLYKPT